ncbi:hypothetical protein BN12_2200010 [Nostocoides japonicum T1-X7]|uniref:Uncharacterized protein n=1 Tax=Nostocoides japonicum T1-X7 TaxID=1194083 RepID=A0A077M0Q2_9MICO|nr:hypothetical protein BN12_2200010 [Tetrasphaera japonica T1-X7]
MRNRGTSTEHEWCAAVTVPVTGPQARAGSIRGELHLRGQTTVHVQDVYCATCRRRFHDVADEPLCPRATPARRPDETLLVVEFSDAKAMRRGRLAGCLHTVATVCQRLHEPLPSPTGGAPRLSSARAGRPGGVRSPGSSRRGLLG